MPLKTIHDQKTITQTSIAQTTSTEAIDLTGVANISIQSVIDVNTPAAKAFATTDVTVAADTITETAHGYALGLKGQFSTTTTLPAGLSLTTDYFVIPVDANTYSVASSLALANAGTVVDITDQGTGTHTFTPTSIAGGTWAVQKTNKTTASTGLASTADADWTDYDTATAVSADATNWYEKIGPPYRWLRVRMVMTAGQMTVNHYVISRGYIN